MIKILIAYASYSGNTKEVAECIAVHLQQEAIQADLCHLGADPYVDVANYDYLFLGSFTWGEGATPDEVKDFIYHIGYKPENVVIFGTGDTQFGDHYCRVVDKLISFYNSPWEGLKIEQSPRGSQKEKIQKWVEGVVERIYDKTNEGKNIRAAISK